MTTLTRITLGRLVRPSGSAIAAAGLIDVDVVHQIGVFMNQGSLTAQIAAFVEVSVIADDMTADVTTPLRASVETINVEVGICNG